MCKEHYVVIMVCKVISKDETKLSALPSSTPSLLLPEVRGILHQQLKLLASPLSETENQHTCTEKM